MILIGRGLDLGEREKAEGRKGVGERREPEGERRERNQRPGSETLKELISESFEEESPERHGQA